MITNWVGNTLSPSCSATFLFFLGCAPSQLDDSVSSSVLDRCWHARHTPPSLPLPHFISGLIWVQVAGVNAVQMQETPCRLARVFQIFGQTRTLLIKAEEIFTVPQTKPRVLILQGPGEQEGPQCYTLFLLKRDDWQLGENFPALNQGSYWRGQIGEQRDLAKQSNSLASCYWWKAWLLFQSFSTPHSRNSFVLLSCFLCTCAQSALHAIDCSALPNKY